MMETNMNYSNYQESADRAKNFKRKTFEQEYSRVNILKNTLKAVLMVAVLFVGAWLTVGWN